MGFEFGNLTDVLDLGSVSYFRIIAFQGNWAQKGLALDEKRVPLARHAQQAGFCILIQLSVNR